MLLVGYACPLPYSNQIMDTGQTLKRRTYQCGVDVEKNDKV